MPSFQQGLTREKSMDREPIGTTNSKKTNLEFVMLDRVTALEPRYSVRVCFVTKTSSGNNCTALEQC